MTDQTINTDKGAVEQPAPEPSGPPEGWHEFASKMFGDNYVPDRDPPKEEPTRAAARDMAGDDADARALMAEGDEEPGQKPERAERDDAATPGDDGIRWSTADARTISALEREIPAFQADLATFEQLRSQIDLNALAATDKAKAAAVRVQLAEAERELRRRQDDIAAAVGDLRQKVQDHHLGVAKRRLGGEAAKLAKALPDLDKAALVPYLKQSGFSEADIKQAADHRLVVLAEKARRYDEMTAVQKKVPKYRKGAKGQQQAESAEFRAAIDDINGRGLTRENATAIIRNLPGKSNVQPTAAQLKARLEATGSMDDAVAFMRAADHERAQATRKGARR